MSAPTAPGGAGGPAGVGGAKVPLPRGRGYQTGIGQPRTAAFWLFVLLLIPAVLFGLLEQLGYLIVAPSGWALSWALMVVYIVPVILLVRWLDLYEREPTSLLVAAFLWGALIATLFAGFGNVFWGSVITKLTGAEFASDWSAAITAPLIEEIYKFLGIVVIYLIARPEIDDLMDGFVYGALVGLGFAVVEDVYYFINAFGGSLGGVIDGFVVRVLAGGLYGHVLYAGLSGIGLAYFVTRQGIEPLGKRLLVAGGLLLTAMAAHFVWNAPFIWDTLPLFLATAVKGLPFLLVLVIALRLARRRENRWLAVALEREVGGPGILPEEMDALRDWRHRRDARKRVRKAAGRDAERTLKRLQRAQVDLAMVASRVSQPADVDLDRQRARCQELRLQLWAAPGATDALGIAPATVEAVRAQPRVVPWLADAQAPAGGLSAWERADPTLSPVATLWPGMPLMVAETAGDWARVRASNGWSGWVDGRLLFRPAPKRVTYWR